MRANILIFLFSLNITAYNQTLESIINKRFDSLNDSCLLYVYPQKEFTIININNKTLNEYNFLNKTFQPLPYVSNIKNSGHINITYVDYNFLAGHFYHLNFAEYMSESFFIFSKKHKMFALFYFAIMSIDINEDNEIITNQKRKDRYTFIGGNPIELYVYDWEFNLLMELEFSTHHTYEHFLKEEFVYRKTLFNEKGREKCIEVPNFYNKAIPLQDQNINIFFEWIKTVYNDKNATYCYELKNKFPAKLFH